MTDINAMQLLYALWGSVVGLIVLAIVHSYKKGTTLAKWFADARKEVVETTTGTGMDLPSDLINSHEEHVVLHVLFVICMVTLVSSTVVLCHKLDKGFGQFWLDFPFAQFAACKDF
mgnify:CR=1 FL=1|tara:strand:+ start:6173 stop:6520 length:348 start_codon:yes stop_codon:yes gene_type:complete